MHPAESRAIYRFTLITTFALALAATVQEARAVLRVATFNTSLSQSSQGALTTALSGTTFPRAQATAEIIQTVRPDVVLLNEFDYDVTGTTINLFQQNYLGVGQNGQSAINYPYIYLAPSNTGIQPEDELGDPQFDFDFNNNSFDTVMLTDDPEDAFGFGRFPGQFGMVLLSQHPIDMPNVRTFREFLWKDMPGALIPDNPFTSAPADFYTQEELDVFRLSSKSHWDIPIQVEGETVHVLASHPTPPVFDGPEDRNGTRNHDEIRFWADYVTEGTGNDYIYDDQGGTGGLEESSGAGASFVILGDQNADPNEGDSIPGAIDQLLNNPRVQDPQQTSQGGPQPDDTATFLGGVRVDYALPSSDQRVLGSGVYWPTSGSGADAVRFSDHRLVYVDLATASTPVVPEPTTLLVWGGLSLTALLRRRR